MTTHVKGLRASGLPARHLIPIVEEFIDQEISHIDGEILTAHNEGRNYIEHAMATAFEIPGMDKKDSQTIMYSELIDRYTRSENEGGKGFVGVKIIRRNNGHYFRVCWKNGLPVEERDRRLKIIMNHTDDQTGGRGGY